MGQSIAELRGLITAITFLGVFVLLIAWIPPEFYQAGTARNVGIPDVFESIDVWAYAETFQYQMNETGGGTIGNKYYITNTGLDIGNRDFTFYYSKANLTEHELKMQHNWYWLIFPQAENLEWISIKTNEDRGKLLDDVEMEVDGENQTEAVKIAKYRAKTKNFQYVAFFQYNSTKWGNFTQAWNHHELYFFWAVNFDEINTSFNILQLIGMLVFFQLPDVNMYLNAIIAIPFWVTVAYLVVVLFVKVIPFIGGG